MNKEDVNVVFHLYRVGIGNAVGSSCIAKENNTYDRRNENTLFESDNESLCPYDQSIT